MVLNIFKYQDLVKINIIEFIINISLIFLVTSTLAIVMQLFNYSLFIIIQ